MIVDAPPRGRAGGNDAGGDGDGGNDGDGDQEPGGSDWKGNFCRA